MTVTINGDEIEIKPKHIIGFYGMKDTPEVREALQILIDDDVFEWMDESENFKDWLEERLE